MCGVVGIMNFDGAPVDRTLLESMCQKLTHRGPDGQGCEVFDSVGLGHRRLAILDLSSNGSQPMSTPDRTVWLSYNGELYNYKELRQELKSFGYLFSSETDTEVVLAAYCKWGLECVHRFNGMFAFAIWDTKLQRLWLVRDRLGIKPLFYSKGDNGISFASEVKPLLEDGKRRKIDEKALSLFLGLNWTPAPYTLFSDIFQLEPGQHLVVQPDGLCRLEKYWDLPCINQGFESEDVLTDRLCSIMQDSVDKRLVSHVPFGAFLSGGLDSSSICWWMSRSIKDLMTFSIGFDEYSYDESSYSEKVAKCLGIHSFQKNISEIDVVNRLEVLVEHAGEPIADSSMLAMYELSALARSHVTMVLSGDGADELLAGYETYFATALAQRYAKFPNWSRRMVSKIVNSLPRSDAKMSFESKLRRFVAGVHQSPILSHASWRMINNVSARKGLCPELFDNTLDSVFELYEEYSRRSSANNLLDKLLWTDTRLYLPNDMLVKVDRMSMAHSLEARVPFLDHRFVEFCFSIPWKWKRKHWIQKKHLLKKAMRGRLPDSIVYRNKAGFNLPIGVWLKHSLWDYANDLLIQGCKEMQFLDRKRVTKLLEDHRIGAHDGSHQIWGLMTLVLWWQKYGRPSL